MAGRVRSKKLPSTATSTAAQPGELAVPQTRLDTSAPVPHAQEQGKAASGHPGASASVLLQGTDTAIKLLQDIKAHRIDPRDITPTQRRACLMLLANGTQTSAELAALFCTTPSTIRMDLKKIRDEVGREVKEWSLSEVIGQLALTAEKCTAHAMKNEDPGLAWTVQRDFAKLLKELGVIRPETDQSGFRMTVEAIGQGYERAREALTLALNPVLTGEVIDATPRAPRATLSLPTRVGNEDDLEDHLEHDDERLDEELAVPQTHHDDEHDGEQGSDLEELAVPQTRSASSTAPQRSFPTGAMGFE